MKQTSHSNFRLSFSCYGAVAPCLPLRLAKSRPSGGCSHAQRLRALVTREVPRRVVLRAANQNRMIAGGNHTLIYRRERKLLKYSAFSLPQSASLTIACGQSGRGSDSPQDCHSLPRLRFAYPRQRGPWCGGHRNDKLQFESPFHSASKRAYLAVRPLTYFQQQRFWLSPRAKA